VKFKTFSQANFRKIVHNLQIICNLFLWQRTLPPIVTEWNQRIYLLGGPPPPPPRGTCCPITGPSPRMGQLLDSGTWHQQQLIQLAAFLTPHTQRFNSQLELTVSSQEYLKELRILLFQRALYKLTSRDVLKKGNYYLFLYNNYICFKSLYAHDKVVCYPAGFSYSVLM
jgi:hypothetical protein